MERIDLMFKSALVFIGALFSILVDGLGVAFAVLSIAMMADYGTGLMVAAVTRSFSSKIGLKGFIKKLYVMILVGVVYLLEINIFQSTHIGDGVCFAYIAIELISITENGGKMGAPVPTQVMQFFELFKNKTGGERK